MHGFAQLPPERRLVLANATLPAALVEAPGLARRADGLLRADILLSGGRIERFDSPGLDLDLPRLDLDGGMVWPCFADLHTHLDKGHIWPRQANPDGTFDAALAAVGLDRAQNWSAQDVRRRMQFGLRCAHAHGTSRLRTHLDSSAPQHRISWPVFAELRDEWAGRIDLQGVALCSIVEWLDEGFARELAQTVKSFGGILGAATFKIPDLDAALARIFRHASEHGLDLDFHVDETLDPAARSLRAIAGTALATKFTGGIVVGHACSLSTQEDAAAAETIRLVAEAGIAVVSLPMCNMYLQDRRAGRTPRRRGVTLLHELKAAGVPVAVASDNTRDPFYPYGDLDMLEVFREAVRIGHLDHPVGDWPAAVTRTPATIMAGAMDGAGARANTGAGTLRQGDPADMVLFRARGWTELLARPQADRTVLRAGRPIDRTLPDYRELDDLMAMA